MDLAKVRERRVRLLINQRFEGVASRLALAIGRSANQVSRWFSEDPNNHRNIGERLARDIEQRLGLPASWLDQAPREYEPEDVPNIRVYTHDKHKDINGIIESFAEHLTPEQLQEIDEDLLGVLKKMLDYATQNALTWGMQSLTTQRLRAIVKLPITARQKMWGVSAMPPDIDYSQRKELEEKNPKDDDEGKLI